MKTTQHTPGKWKVQQVGLNYEIRDAENPYANGIIAETTGEDIARLIAAAPELLEACRIALADESTSSKVAKVCYAAIANAGALTPISAQRKGIAHFCSGDPRSRAIGGGLTNAKRFV